MTDQISLDPKEWQRYSRHLALPNFTEFNQRRLKKSRVLVIGAGGLGSPLLYYITAAGIGKIGIVDFDKVELSNLHRQILFSAEDVGSYKTEVAKKKLSLLNPHVRFESYCIKLDKDNIMEIVKEYDIIADGSDNFPTRYLVNDACVLSGKPLVYGSVHQYEGQISVFNQLRKNKKRGPNYRDLFPKPPAPEMVPNCEQGGVLGVLPGIIGAMQANEVIKIAAGIGDVLDGKLFIFDVECLLSRTIKINKSPSNVIHKLIDYEEFCFGSRKSTNNMIKEISVNQLKEWLDKKKDFQLIDVREFFEREISSIGGQHIPMGEINQKVTQIEKDKDVVIYCRSGNRSGNAVLALQEIYGFGNLYNLKGGILDWSDQIDPSIRKY